MDIDLDDRWAIMGKIHGGYLLREIVTPLLTDDHPHPFAVSATFVRSPDGGPATVESEPLRVGRRISQHRATLSQGGEIQVEALVTTGRHDPDAEPLFTTAQAPVLTPVDQCFPMSSQPPGAPARIGHWDFLDGRADPETMGFAIGAPTGKGRLAAYVTMPDHDTRAEDLLVIADCMPPVTLDLGIQGWVPTLELTVLVRDLPAPGWLAVEQRSRLVQDGWLEEDCDIWDSRGRLVCQARQLAGYRPPP